jgi:hypothetical protein
VTEVFPELSVCFAERRVDVVREVVHLAVEGALSAGPVACCRKVDDVAQENVFFLKGLRRYGVTSPREAATWSSGTPPSAAEDKKPEAMAATIPPNMSTQIQSWRPRGSIARAPLRRETHCPGKAVRSYGDFGGRLGPL